MLLLGLRQVLKATLILERTLLLRQRQVAMILNPFGKMTLSLADTTGLTRSIAGWIAVLRLTPVLALRRTLLLLLRVSLLLRRPVSDPALRMCEGGEQQQQGTEESSTKRPPQHRPAAGWRGVCREFGWCGS